MTEAPAGRTTTHQQDNDHVRRKWPPVPNIGRSFGGKGKSTPTLWSKNYNSLELRRERLCPVMPLAGMLHDSLELRRERVRTARSCSCARDAAGSL